MDALCFRFEHEASSTDTAMQPDAAKCLFKLLGQSMWLNTCNKKLWEIFDMYQNLSFSMTSKFWIALTC